MTGPAALGFCCHWWLEGRGSRSVCYSGAARKAEIGTPEQSSLRGAGPQWAGVRVGEYEVGDRNAPLVNEASRSGSR